MLGCERAVGKIKYIFNALKRTFILQCFLFRIPTRGSMALALINELSVSGVSDRLVRTFRMSS